jgi:hypothetical protein
MNPYTDMPLPIGVRIDFDFFTRNGARPPVGMSDYREGAFQGELEDEAYRAINRWYYGEDDGSDPGSDPHDHGGYCECCGCNPRSPYLIEE